MGWVGGGGVGGWGGGGGWGVDVKCPRSFNNRELS